jgi:hypothetical protein
LSFLAVARKPMILTQMIGKASLGRPRRRATAGPSFLLGQPKNDIREREAGRLYGLWSAADTWSDPLPGIVERLPKCLQLLWAVRGILDKSARFHPSAPTAAACTSGLYSIRHY